MADTEEYFPRGGKKPTFKDFKQTSNFLGTVEKGEKKKKKPKKKSEGDDGYLSDEIAAEFDQSSKNCAIGIGYQIVKEGLQILGRISQVLETKLNVSLPCRMQGTVMACHVSEAYNKLLEAYVADQVDSVRELPQMFRPGQYVACKVLEVEKANLMLTLMPQHINNGKLHSDIQKGAILQAAVSSVEDHGYVMELGIPNTRAFLPKKNVNEDIELDNGVLTWCSVKKIEVSADNSIVTLTNQLAALQNPTKRKPSKGVGVLVPGATIEFTVDKALENGIEGHIFDGITAYIQRQHADKVRGKKPSLGQRIVAHLLYEMPTRKTPFCTMRSIFETSFPDLGAEQKYQPGDIVEDAQVIKITSRSIVFKLGADSAGTMSLKRVQAAEDLTDEQIIAKSYPMGSEHKVRILHYNLSDFRYSVSDSASTLSERYFSLQQLSVGEVVDALVQGPRGNGLMLQVGRLTGYIPPTHISDAGVYVDPKKPNTNKVTKKKYKPGTPVRARVLILDANSNSLVLTLKPSLLEDEDPLTSYKDAAIGKAYTGVIKYVNPEYVIVSFFNNVVAFVPKGYVTKEPIDNLAEAFHAGQIVKCTILKVDPENKKMTGSLTTIPFWPAKKLSEKSKRKQQDTNEVPNKKRKTDVNEPETQITEKHKKKKDKKSKQDDEQEHAEMTEIEDTKKSKKKKDKTSKHEEEQEDVDMREKEDTKKSKKKKDNNKTPDTEVVSKRGEKKNKSKVQATKDIKSSKKKEIEGKYETEDDSDNENEHKASEESDAIDTDLPSDDQILTPQDMQLIDMSDCTTQKHFKKRTVSLIKSIEARAKRIAVIEEKIKSIEQKGLTAKNKKYHTAMHSEKIVVQERIKILVEAMTKAQEKLKEFPAEEIKDYKKKKLEKRAKRSTSEENVKVTTKKVKKNKKNKELDPEKAKEKLIKEKVKVIKVADSNTSGLEMPSVKDFWSESNVENIYKSSQQQDEESSSSDEEKEEQPKKKRKKLSAAEKVAKAREEEERLRELERIAIESSSRPQSVEQFERALLANPDSSQLWIAYMAFHLQSTEIEKARAVARKALNTISFREEQEKMNVWLALINVENRFGTKETQQKTLEEALQMNDTFKIQSKLLDIYTETSKLQELVDLMVRKYKRDPQTYILCGGACYRLGLVDKARQIMQKAISVLEKKEHVTVLVQFALLENGNGDRERAEALFEQVLGVYPQRVDVCAAYVDMLLKCSDVDRVRQVMERMTSQKIPARKMKVLYKKWIEVEEKIGDEQQIERIRQKAVDFIENAKF